RHRDARGRGRRAGRRYPRRARRAARPRRDPAQPVTAPPTSADPIARLLDDLAARKPAAIARAVSIVENHRPGFDRLLSALHPSLGHARRVGITGPPGAGKSTLTTALAQALRREGRRVAIVAVDPTSPFTGGALLGD